MGIGALSHGIDILLTHAVKVVISEQTAIRGDSDERFPVHDV
jgi:hypothetical protein